MSSSTFSAGRDHCKEPQQLAQPPAEDGISGSKSKEDFHRNDRHSDEVAAVVFQPSRRSLETVDVPESDGVLLIGKVAH